MKHIVKLDTGEYLTAWDGRTKDLQEARVYKAKNGATTSGNRYLKSWYNDNRNGQVKAMDFQSLPVHLALKATDDQPSAEQLRDALSKLAEELPESMIAENTPFSDLTDLIYTLN